MITPPATHGRSPARPTSFSILAGRRVPMLDRARMYVCGIISYDVTHLGHAVTCGC